jgi:hypothetical protein
MMIGNWSPRGWGIRGDGMMGGNGIMSNLGYSPFGWLGMIFMWLIPVGLIALAVFGVVWLVRNARKSTPPSS